MMAGMVLVSERDLIARLIGFEVRAETLGR